MPRRGTSRELRLRRARDLTASERGMRAGKRVVGRDRTADGGARRAAEEVRPALRRKKRGGVPPEASFGRRRPVADQTSRHTCGKGTPSLGRGRRLRSLPRGKVNGNSSEPLGPVGVALRTRSSIGIESDTHLWGGLGRSGARARRKELFR